MIKRELTPHNKQGEALLNMFKPLLPIMENKNYVDIVIRQEYQVAVSTRNNDTELIDLPELDQEEIKFIIQCIKNIAKVPNDAGEVSTILPINKFRFSGDLGKGVVGGFFASIRLNDAEIYSLTSFGINKQEATFLKNYVTSNGGFIVAGATNSGKTSLINSLFSYISEKENVICLGDLDELIINNKVSFLAKTPEQLQAKFDLLTRSNPTRIVIPELKVENANTILRAISLCNNLVNAVHVESLDNIADAFFKNIKMSGEVINNEQDKKNSIVEDLSKVGLHIQMKNKKLVDIKINDPQYDQLAKEQGLFKYKQSKATNQEQARGYRRYSEKDINRIKRTLHKLNSIRATARLLDIPYTTINRLSRV